MENTNAVPAVQIGNGVQSGSLTEQELEPRQEPLVGAPAETGGRPRRPRYISDMRSEAESLALLERANGPQIKRTCRQVAEALGIQGGDGMDCQSKMDSMAQKRALAEAISTQFWEQLWGEPGGDNSRDLLQRILAISRWSGATHAWMLDQASSLVAQVATSQPTGGAGLQEAIRKAQAWQQRLQEWRDLLDVGTPASAGGGEVTDLYRKLLAPQWRPSDKTNLDEAVRLLVKMNGPQLRSLCHRVFLGLGEREASSACEVKFTNPRQQEGVSATILDSKRRLASILMQRFWDSMEASSTASLVDNFTGYLSASMQMSPDSVRELSGDILARLAALSKVDPTANLHLLRQGAAVLSALEPLLPPSSPVAERLRRWLSMHALIKR